MKAGNQPNGTRWREAADRIEHSSGGIDGEDIEPRGHLNATTEDRGTGPDGTDEATSDHAGPTGALRGVFTLAQRRADPRSRMREFRTSGSVGALGG